MSVATDKLFELANRIEPCAVILRSADTVLTRPFGSLDNLATAELLRASARRIVALTEALSETLDYHRATCAECSADGPSKRHAEFYDLVRDAEDHQ